MYIVVLQSPPSPAHRLRLLRQPCERGGGHPGHERLPGGHQEAQGAAEEVQGRIKAVLKKTGETGGGDILIDDHQLMARAVICTQRPDLWVFIFQSM